MRKRIAEGQGTLILLIVQLLFIGIFIVSSALSRNFETTGQKAMYGFGIVSLLLLLAYAVWRLMQRRPEVPGKKRRALWVATAAVGMILAALTSATFVDDIHASTVEIWCGEKNPLSQGAEVWLSRYQIAGTSQSMMDLRIEESQNVYYNAENDNYVYSDADGSGTGYLRLRINPGKKVRLIFIQHSWSGIIKVSQNGGSPVEIDLYSKEPTSRGYTLAIAPSEHVVVSYLIEAIFLLIGKFSLFQVILYSFALGIAGSLQAKKNQRTLGGLSFAGGVLLPSPILLALFVQNANYIDFPLVLLLCLVAAVLLSFLWAAVYLVTRSALASYISCIVATVFLFGSGALVDALPNSWDATGSYSMWLCIGIAAVLLLIVMAVCHGKTSSVIVNSFAAIFTAIFLLMNIVPSVGIYIKQRSADIGSNTKQDYIIDPPSDEPNVYWIHCDGMLGFSSVEKYFGDGQEEVKQELADRGFVVNENAAFEAGHSTSACVPALMCPDFYDENMMKLVESCKGDSTQVQYAVADEAYERLLSEQRYYNETTMAFGTAGFQTVNILAWNWGGGGYFPPNTDKQFCCMDSNIVELIIDKEKTLKTEAQFSGGSFTQFEDFVEKTMYPFKKIMDQIDFSGLEDLMLESSAEKRVVSDEVLKDPLYPQVTQCIIPALQNSQSPRFCILAYAQAHRPFIYNEQGEKIAENNENPVDYLPQHKYAVKVIFNAVDTILAADPDAVIILQADHGLHGNFEKEFKEAFGDDAVASELWNQVFSAIRVPEKYQNGDEIYAYTNPLNISRYLVNNFVGEGNYAYLEAS